MKKFLFIIPVLVVSLLVGCGNKGGTIECTLSSKDVVNGYELNSTYKIKYTNDYVNSVETVEVVSSDNSEVLDYFKKNLEDTYKKTNENYGGYDYNVTKDQNKVTANVTIDYSKMNLDQFIKDQPALKSYTKDGKLLVDGVKSLYEAMGATCK